MAQADAEQESEPVIYQLTLGKNNFPSHVEVVYRWCGKHQMAYNVHPFNGGKAGPNPRKYGECPWCWRERVAKERAERKR